MQDKFFTFSVIFSVIFICKIEYHDCEEYCYSEKCDGQAARYLFYDINPPEGFNLRRDVYMRFAVLARRLSNSKDVELSSFKLVLPPWSHLIHWHHNKSPEHIPWSVFFDLDSLKLFAPVIEMHEFFSALTKKYTKVKIEEVYVLQHFQDMFQTGNFEERMEVQTCQRYRSPTYFHFDNVTSQNVKCLSFHGHTINLAKILKESQVNTIMFDHAEVALHHRFGDKEYWMARRSMRFSKHLRNVALSFRQTFLNSTDDSDYTILPDNWLLEKPGRHALGGPYIAAHLRRKDFAANLPHRVPSLEQAAKQVNEVLKKLKLEYVFIATDASKEEYAHLKSLIDTELVFRFLPHENEFKYIDGEVAIIDQIICSHARYFIGTHESTFSLRIHEEREIVGFPTETTFNVFCKGEGNCEKASVWKIVY